MPIEDIKALPVSELAAKDCALFLWITMPMLHEAWGVMEAWGFRFVTAAFVWVKLSRKSNTVFWGPGHWTRANAELCLLATRATPNGGPGTSTKSLSPMSRSTAGSRTRPVAA